MEPILHIVVEIQGQTQLSELLGCFCRGLPNPVARERGGCSGSPCPGPASSDARRLALRTRLATAA